MEDHLGILGHPAALPRTMLVGFVDAVPAAAAILDANANIIAVNSVWRRFAHDNGGSPDGWIGANYLRVAEQAGDRDAALIADGLRAVLAGRLNSFDHEYPCHSSDIQRWFRCLVAPLTSDGDGSVVGGAVIHLDISAQKLAEQRALTASRAKSEFLASLSHELRTPLNAVIGFSELIDLEVWGPLGDARYRGYAADIRAAGSHLLSLINEVLDLSKVEAGRYDLHEDVVELAAVTHQAVALIGNRAERGGVEVVTRPLQHLPRLVADPRLLRQILLNLLSNAVKFTLPGGRVTIAAAMTGDGGLELRVSDTGIGIDGDDLDRVMEPFGQVNSSQARRLSGESTGLGLPLARRFAELHGGTLHLDSRPGLGTTVAVRLPPERVVV